MSTILDSLKKSSDQRDSKENSSMNNFNFGSSKNSSPSRYLFLLLFVVVFAFGFYYFMKHFYYSDETSTNMGDTKELNKAANTEIANGQNTNKIAKPDVRAVKERVKQLESNKMQREKDLAQSHSNQDLKSTEEDGEQPQGNISKQATQRGQNRAQVSTDQANDKTPEDREVSALEQRINNQSQGIVKAVAPSEYEVQQQDYQYVHQLPFSIRKDLPKFKLNVHIFDKDPMSRIAIINGVRFYVNDMIEETVLVKDIIQEGVLLDYNGEVFLVPR